jgi:hypothetical protein
MMMVVVVLMDYHRSAVIASVVFWKVLVPMLILEMPIVIELVMILVLFVMAVSLGLLSILPTTHPVLCHRNAGTEEGKHRWYHNNLYKFRFHRNPLPVEICPLRRNISGNGLQKMTAHQSEKKGIRSPAGKDQLFGCGG